MAFLFVPATVEGWRVDKGSTSNRLLWPCFGLALGNENGDDPLPVKLRSVPLLVALLGAPALGYAQELPPIPLPTPLTSGGIPLMDALRQRKTVRDFTADKLSPQLLSNLLWAGFGINRPEIAHRTAPSALNAQEVDIYVATADGLYLYNAIGNRLEPILASDVRPKTSGQEFARIAPVSLIFVADYARMAKTRPEQKEFYSGIDTGFISQNIYLFCASAGLGTVVHDLDRSVLARSMPLRPEQRIVLAQAVGVPKK